MSVKLLTEHHLEFLSLKGGCTGSSKSTLVKMPNCRESHVMADMIILAPSPYSHRKNLYGNTFLVLFSNKMVIRAGIHKMIVRIANREDPDQTASSVAV